MPKLHGLPEEGQGYLPAGRLAGQPAAALRPPDIAADQCQQSIPEVIGPADDGENIRNQVHRTDDQAGRSQESKPRQDLGQRALKPGLWNSQKHQHQRDQRKDADGCDLQERKKRIHSMPSSCVDTRRMRRRLLRPIHEACAPQNYSLSFLLPSLVSQAREQEHCHPRVGEEGQSRRDALLSPQRRAPCEYMPMTSHEMPPEHTPL
jgi:hypothetical protein